MRATDEALAIVAFGAVGGVVKWESPLWLVPNSLLATTR